MRTDAGLFANTGEQVLYVENRARWRRGLVIVAGIRIEVGRRQTKAIGPFPVHGYGPRIEYAASPQLAVQVVDVPTMMRENKWSTKLPHSITCPPCGWRTFHNPTRTT